MKNLIAIVGMCGSGKSLATSFFSDKGYKVIYFGGVTLKKLKEENIEVNETNEKMMREKLRKELGMGAYALILLDEIKNELTNNNVVLDGVYSWSELKILKQEFENLKVLAIVTNRQIRYERISKRTNRPYNNEDANKRDISEIETLEKGGPIAYADYFICNNDDINEFNKKLEDVYKMIERRK